MNVYSGTEHRGRDMGKRMLTVAEVAEKTGAAERTVRLWIKTGRLRGAKSVKTPMGEYWTVPESSVEGVKVRPRGRPPKPEPQAGAKSTGSKR